MICISHLTLIFKNQANNHTTRPLFYYRLNWKIFSHFLNKDLLINTIYFFIALLYNGLVLALTIVLHWVQITTYISEHAGTETNLPVALT